MNIPILAQNITLLYNELSERSGLDQFVVLMMVQYYIQAEVQMDSREMNAQQWITPEEDIPS
jgi:glucan phosphorylase